MNSWAVGLACAGLLLLPSVSLAQDDFSGQWQVAGSTQIWEMAVSPFASAAPPIVITQTSDAISWQTVDGREQTIRLNGPSVVAGRIYTARWVHRALLLEAHSTRTDGRAVTILQILSRNANDELELVSFTPLLRSAEGTEIGRLVYHRRR